MPHYYTTCRLVSSDKPTEKLDKLYVKGSVKLSILSGLLEVDGSADYLKKEKREIRESKVYIIIHIGTVVKSMTMALLAKDKVHYQEEVMATRRRSSRIRRRCDIYSP